MATNELQEVKYFIKHYEHVVRVVGGAEGRGYIYLLCNLFSLGTCRKRGKFFAPFTNQMSTSKNIHPPHSHIGYMQFCKYHVISHIMHNSYSCHAVLGYGSY